MGLALLAAALYQRQLVNFLLPKTRFRNIVLVWALRPTPKKKQDNLLQTIHISPLEPPPSIGRWRPKPNSFCAATSPVSWRKTLLLVSWRTAWQRKPAPTFSNGSITSSCLRQ